VQLSFISLKFLLISGSAIVLLPLLRGWMRQVAFLLINLAFVAGFLLGPKSAAVAVAFILTGYAITLLIRRWPIWGFRGGLVFYVLLFVYLRNYGILASVLPESLLAKGLITVGLSFLFFKIVHVMIETSSGTLGPLTFPQYLNYCLNFTAYMMGPIQRFQDFRDQWTGEKEAIPLTFEAHLDALLRILIGFVKAYVIADAISPYALAESPDLLTMPLSELVLGIYAFYFFLYFNFSGYCDVVIGVGCLMGVRPPENFDKPYLARNISDFWNRFHRSLTQWLTDFVFSPAYKWALTTKGGAKRPLLSMNLSLMLTMVVSGLWHGTTLGFLLFGVVHGLYFVAFRTGEALFTRRFGKKRLRAFRKSRLVTVLSVATTLTAVSLSFVFFRLEAASALAVLGRLVGL